MPSSRSATLVKMVFFLTVFTALGLVFEPVPGATPKNPASGLIAQSLPSEPTRSQEMSSPTVLFILERLCQQPSPGPCVMLGFGPGLMALRCLRPHCGY